MGLNMGLNMHGLEHKAVLPLSGLERNTGTQHVVTDSSYLGLVATDMRPMLISCMRSKLKAIPQYAACMPSGRYAVDKRLVTVNITHYSSTRHAIVTNAL